MQITDRIRSSATDHEIHLLLSSYLDAMRRSGERNPLSQTITGVPLTDIADVNRRVGELLLELDAASKRLDHPTCMRIKEALHIFAAASDRLQMLAAEHQRTAPQTHRHPT